MTAKASEGLGKSTLDDSDAVGDPFQLTDSATVCSVETNGVDFVEIRQGIVPFCKIDYRPDWRDVPLHRINAFERDQLWPIRFDIPQQFLQMSHIVMFEDQFFASGLPDSVDH
jgi:hypothetical protein